MNNSKTLTSHHHLPPSLLFFLCFSCLQLETTFTEAAVSIVDVGLILDLDTWVGRMSQSCISVALSDFYSTHNHTKRMVIHARHSNQDTIDAASAAIELVKDVQVQAILGPQTSSEAEFVGDIGKRTKVPVISFSATSPSIAFTQTPYFIRTALSDSTQVKAVAALVQAFGWREIVPVYESTPYGKDMIPYLVDAVQDVNARVPYRSVLTPKVTNDQILGELFKLKTMQTRVFVVHMTSPLASRLFLKAKEDGMMSKGYAWIITHGLTDLLLSMDSSVVECMQGVLGVIPHVPQSKKLDEFKARWRRKFLQDHPADAYAAEPTVLGLWAYDTVWALATAMEKVETTNPRFQKSNDLSIGLGRRNYSTDLSNLGISQIGQELLQAILATKFEGLSGEFWLNEGQMQSSAFQIVNVMGKGKREIGFWTPSLGISGTFEDPELQLNRGKTYSASKSDLRAIIWPGESTEVPKGWEVPIGERKLRIGVPVKDGFFEFVNLDRNRHTNATTVTGFCINVFKAVIDSLPYALPYEFIPFANASGQSAGSYNELIYQIPLQKYDAVVGDTTIWANRSSYVDFTLPYTESGVSMIVPIKDDHKKNAWIFLKPLTMGLWLTTGAFFIFTGFVVWFLEHQVNQDFRGPPSQQVGIIFWFSFSTLVFAHKEKLVSNLSRFVMIIWVFVVLILTSSYTASLTSMLTVQQLQPTITDIKDLIKSNDYVGYQRGSFITGLMERLHFDMSKLRSYNTLEEYDEALTKGSQDGGVAAIIDEIPYIKLFLAKYCNKYAIVGPTYKTAGFGFAFPKGSPLVADISRAILNVTEGDKMMEIEQAWFESRTHCPEQEGIPPTSSSLTLDSFKGLFLIAGLSSAIALFIFLVIFLHENRHVLTSPGSLRQKVISMVTNFDKQKEISAQTSKKIYSFDKSQKTMEVEEETIAQNDRYTPKTLTTIEFQSP